jgi:hypothetical protein
MLVVVAGGGGGFDQTHSDSQVPQLLLSPAMAACCSGSIVGGCLAW